MDENVGKFLTQQLYPDAKTWVATLAKKLSRPLQKAKADRFESPSEVLDALKSNRLETDSWITLQCKPLLFGPFLRKHFLSTIIGSHSDMRLGPPLLSDNPIMGMISQATTHLKPVGLYPPIDDDLYQICLYPSDANACGMVGLLPGVNQLVEYLPAVTSGKNLTFSGAACRVKGIIRQVPPKLLTDIGIPIEKWEELRQQGNIWFLDLSDEYSECVPLDGVVTTEIWGAMYASGHLEIVSGELKIDSLVDAFASAFHSNGFEPDVARNHAGAREIGVFSRGIRSLIGSQYPLFSVHMDAELAIDYKSNRAKFDRICRKILQNTVEVCQSQSVELANPLDLDFSYTDSSDVFTVLQSVGSKFIDDPLALAIRDWHRKRGVQRNPETSDP